MAHDAAPVLEGLGEGVVGALDGDEARREVDALAVVGDDGLPRVLREAAAAERADRAPAALPRRLVRVAVQRRDLDLLRDGVDRPRAREVGEAQAVGAAALEDLGDDRVARDLRGTSA